MKEEALGSAVQGTGFRAIDLSEDRERNEWIESYYREILLLKEIALWIA